MNFAIFSRISAVSSDLSSDLNCFRSAFVAKAEESRKVGFGFPGGILDVVAEFSTSLPGGW